MILEYKLIYNVKIEADDENEGDEKADALFCSLYDVEDVDGVTILDNSNYYQK